MALRSTLQTLTRDERMVVERAFRNKSSNIRVLAATTTVAAGINTPASTVIIAEQEFLGEDGREFTVAEYKNMAGRAGRLGYNEKGKCIIYAENSLQRRQLFAKYVQGRLEPITSSFRSDEIDTWVLRLLAQVDRVERTELPALLTNTFGGFLMVKSNPGAREFLVGQVDALVDRMIRLGLVETSDSYVSLTLLGRACGRSALRFSSSLRLVELVRSMDPSLLTAERLMVLLQALPDSSGGYTPMLKRGQAESVRPQQAAARFGDAVVRLLQTGASDQFEYLARCKRAAILGDWISGAPIEEIESRYSPNPYQGNITAGNIRGFADATRLYFRAAFTIATLVLISAALDVDEVDMLLKRLEVGLPKAALPILDALPGLDRGVCLALHNSGISTIDAISVATEEDLIAVVGKKAARDLQARVKTQTALRS